MTTQGLLIASGPKGMLVGENFGCGSPVGKMDLDLLYFIAFLGHEWHTDYLNAAAM